MELNSSSGEGEKRECGDKKNKTAIMHITYSSKKWFPGQIQISQRELRTHTLTGEVAEFGHAVFSGALIQRLELLSSLQVLVEDLQPVVCL